MNSNARTTGKQGHIFKDKGIALHMTFLGECNPKKNLDLFKKKKNSSAYWSFLSKILNHFFFIYSHLILSHYCMPFWLPKDQTAFYLFFQKHSDLHKCISLKCSNGYFGFESLRSSVKTLKEVWQGSNSTWTGEK